MPYVIALLVAIGVVATTLWHTMSAADNAGHDPEPVTSVSNKVRTESQGGPAYTLPNVENWKHMDAMPIRDSTGSVEVFWCKRTRYSDAEKRALGKR